MSIKPDQREMKRIYEKSIRLLDSSQSQLRHMQQVLKKAVIRLSSLSPRCDERVNTIVDEVAVLVNHKIDLVTLEKKLDELFVLTNQNEGQISELQAFKNSVNLAVDDIVENDKLDSYKVELKKIVNSKLDQSQLASAVVGLFKRVADEAEAYQQQVIDQHESVKIFAEKMAGSMQCKIDTDADSVDEILASLTHELLPYVNQHLASNDSSPLPDNVDINRMLVEFIQQLSLHDDVKTKKNTLVKELAYPVDTPDTWKAIFNRMVDIVNDSINAIHLEKQELQSFITRIIQQLVDIEEYVQKARADTEDSAVRSEQLNDTVNQDVDTIQNTVADASDINVLKKDVQSHLSNIRKNVEENKKLLKEKDQESRESYKKMMKELTTTQRESQRLKEQLKESHSQLLRDELTGLPNRMAFNERISAEYHRWKRTGTPLCVAMWDIDHFKQFNDNYGHDVGDRVLKIVANLIHSRIRKVDMFARYGGEEFVLLMPDTELEDALALNDNLRVKLSEADFHYNGDKCVITTSIGVAAFNQGETIEEVMKRADIALYQSKDGGRNRCTASQ